MLSQVMPKAVLDGTLEWQECRSTIARFDQILADTRRYGFTLVTVLLTASALVTPSNPAVARTAASIVVMVLLLALYMIENYYVNLQRATASRAIAIEASHAHLSGKLSEVASLPLTRNLISAVYCLFVLVAAGIAFIADVTGSVSVGPLIVLFVALAVNLAAMFVVHKVTAGGRALQAVMKWLSRALGGFTADRPA